MSADEALAWGRFMTHLAKCPDCARLTHYRSELCETGQELHHVWGDAAKLADRQAHETDVAFALDDEYTAHPGDEAEA